MQFSLVILTLAALASARPSSRQQGQQQQTSKDFKLVARVAANPTAAANAAAPNVDGYVVSGYHTGAGTGFAVLYPDPASARVFYQNGTADQVAAGQATLNTDGGTPPFPFGLLADFSDAPASPLGRGSLFINVGSGTPGLQTGAADYVYYACASAPPAPLAQGAVRLLVRNAADQPVHNDCQDVQLQAVCAQGTGVAHEFASDVECVAA